jgi:hypothetical protein
MRARCNNPSQKRLDFLVGRSKTPPVFSSLFTEGEDETSGLVCSYYTCTYDLDGRLMRAARMNNTRFDAKK